jgi:hypothetical protein
LSNAFTPLHFEASANVRDSECAAIALTSPEFLPAHSSFTAFTAFTTGTFAIFTNFTSIVELEL